eukprot:1147815-Pelagomonas_calceolata.AAC.2
MHVPAQSCVAQVPDQPKHASNTTQQLQRALFMARKFRHMAAQWQQAGGRNEDGTGSICACGDVAEWLSIEN